MQVSSTSVGENLKAVKEKISTCCSQHNLAPPNLVAVSKFQPVETILEAYQAGQRMFGENYVQEIVSKAPSLPEDIQWHFIGMLQSNKAKQLVSGVKNLEVVESVHSAKTATALNNACMSAERRSPLKIYIQVLTSGEESKSGCLPEEVIEIAQHVKSHCPALELKGLMTIGKLGDPNPEPYFALLRECRKKLAESLQMEETDLHLSMGMSGDFEKAIAAGSTSVRVGTSIFGERPPKQ
ncbi:hypothetical protein GUITHDRAFT_63073 [Guillardia theta CCMP2712]|uniref:Pyridoxal phosphate homeostasis protein n=2 Tax=Guillardia theta TaxID=55529 RepID=L1K3U1_GUITC|nr:hypothetical protein GUITHDRAFT_63073 [Guillardia theta CCMP2712]EKX55033.1 hypothetical protein GUITHDRAFT_63073 [Guillardia theta CCMP2712]|eukprot:XP_005842013.1 hypothetical protein GUITHDRAFT_63073 [Guillardia theta CCMP2712]